MSTLKPALAPPEDSVPKLDAAAPSITIPPRNSVLVRITHWINTLCFLALLVSGTEIILSHPRFYWGETGNVLTKPLFKLPLPSSRRLVPTGYGYVLADQNGWCPALYFDSSLVMGFTIPLDPIWGLVAPP